MKKSLLLITMMFFALCASAQGASPTKQEIVGKCKILQNSINLLKSKLVDIRKAEQDKILQQKQDTIVKQELLASNDSLLEKANQIVNKAQICYEQDTTSNIVPLALNTVQKGLGAYVDVVFKEQEAINIDVKEDFDKIINEQLTKFDYALQNLEKEMDDSNLDASGKEKNEENNSLDLLIILEIIGFAVILCVVCIIYLLAKSNSSKGIHRMKEELERKISNNKEAIFNLSGKVKENLGNTENNAKGGLTEKQIRDMIFSEINKYQKSIENHIVGKSMQEQFANTVSSHGENEQTAENGVTKQNDYRLYGQLQNDGSFKVSQSDSRNAFYILSLKDTKAGQAEFFLKDFDKETAKALIEGRQMHLVPACVIESSASPQKIIVVKPGLAEKQGNSWFVKSKAQIRLINA